MPMPIPAADVPAPRMIFCGEGRLFTGFEFELVEGRGGVPELPVGDEALNIEELFSIDICPVLCVCAWGSNIPVLVLLLLKGCADVDVEVEGRPLLPAEVGRFTALGPCPCPCRAVEPFTGDAFDALLKVPADSPPCPCPCFVEDSSREYGAFAGT